MKVLKVLALIVFCITLFVSAQIFQASYAIKGVALSPETYKKVLTKENVLSMTKNNKQESGKPQKVDEPDATQLLDKVIDQSWLDKQKGPLVDGLFTYLKGDASTLPVLDISDLKQKIFDIQFDEMLKKPGNQKLKIDREKVRSEFNSKNDIPTKIDFNEMINKTPDLQGKIGVDYIKSLFQGANKLPLVALFNIILAAIAIVLLALYPKSLFKWLGFTFILSGLVPLIPNLLFSTAKAFKTVDSGPNKFLLEQTSVIQNFMLKEQIVFLVLGVIFVIVGFLPYIRKASAKMSSTLQDSPNLPKYKILREIAPFIMLLLMLANIFIFTVPIIKSATSITGDIFKTDQLVPVNKNP